MSTPDSRPAPAMTLESLQGMTDEKINVLVAEKVTGWHWWTPYCSDHTAAASVRAEIARRKLGVVFVDALCRVVLADHEEDDDGILCHSEIFALVDATPRQVSLAALLTVHAEPSNG